MLRSVVVKKEIYTNEKYCNDPEQGCCHYCDYDSDKCNLFNVELYSVILHDNNNEDQYGGQIFFKRCKDCVKSEVK